MNQSVAALLGEEVEPAEEFKIDMRSVMQGVSYTWLSQAFRMDKATVRKKLTNCPTLKMARGNTPVFDLAQAAGYLVKPKVDLNTYLKSLRPQDLPPLLQKEFWDARLKRQRWEEKAGELWPTQDVIDTFAETFKTMKNTMQLWVDTLERKEGLTQTQRTRIIGLVDELQEQLHAALVEMPKLRQTRSQLAQADPEEPETGDDE